VGRLLEPCKGNGAFTRAMPNCDWFEIDEGRDFLKYYYGHWDWVITNPPWSDFRRFLRKSMEVSDNVVFLCLINAFFMKARLRDMKEMDFGITEILTVDTPPKPWPQTGFALGVTHLKRSYFGCIKFGHLQYEG